ncbi:transposase [Streptomyces sp. NPDC051133]|uniref:transposase n=1 Tax=Streptomyces sp. NPDC051133 TaxID=3155521 RepID=UPI003440EB24
MAKHLDEQVARVPQPSLDYGPYSCVWGDALPQKVWEDGRIISVHTLIAVAVNADDTLAVRRWRVRRPTPA